MRKLDQTAAVEFAVLELQARVRLLTTRRADRAWKALIDQVHSRSAVVVETLLSACRKASLHRIVDGACPAVSTHPPQEECVGELAVQVVLATLRRHLAEAGAPSAAEAEAPGASERFGISQLRRHRVEIRRMFEAVKVELWTSVVQAALREAGALVVRVEARSTEAEVEVFRHHLAEALEKTPSPLETPGAELQAVAEYVAAEQVLARLGRRPALAPEAAARPRRAREPEAVSLTGFQPLLLA